MPDTLARLRERDPEAAEIVERDMRAMLAEYEALMAEGRKRWGDDYRIVAWTPTYVP